MKFGADRKRLAFLGALCLIGVYVVWTNFISSDSSSSPSTSARSSVAQAPLVTAPTDNARANARRNRAQRPTEWNPPYRTPGVVIDPVKVDPTLRLDLLAKVQQVEVSGAQRNLFQFGDAVKPPSPLTPLPPVKKILVNGPKPGSPIQPAGPPSKPVAPPISLKYYGYSSPRSSNRRRAFFLDGEDIIVASEGELMKRRYRLVKIGVNSVTVEDTQFNSEQTLPLAEDAAAG